MVMFVRGIEDKGVPDMIPVDESIDRPIGRDPDEMEKKGLVACISGEAE